MTSGINTTFLSTIDETYPVAGVNNSSQGFRNNFARIKEGLGTTGKELTYLQGKKIEIVGDATGVSGALGNTLAQPDPIQLVLAPTGVAAGTYSTLNNQISLAVDAKGRITALTQTATPTRPVAGAHPATSVGTSHPTNVKQITIPNFTLDDYGTVVEVGSNSFDIGLEGHTLAKGNLIVGTESGAAKALAMPQTSFLPTDYVVLAWRPITGNEYGLAWTKLPAPTPVNPAKVISVVGGEGITVAGTDPANPVVEFDINKYPDLPTTQALSVGSKVLIWDADTNSEYRLDIARLNPETGPVAMRLKDDLTPTLGGNLNVSGYKIVGERQKGIVLETLDSGPFVLRNVVTIDPNFYNPNNPDPYAYLDPADYKISEQRFPTKAPVFTAAELAAGTTSAILKSKADGVMYWEKATNTVRGVTEINPGRGISFSPVGAITSTGTINLDFTAEPVRAPDIFSDSFVAVDANRTLYKNTISKFTFTVPRILTVDPEYGSNAGRARGGQLNDPYKTIGMAIGNIPDDSPDLHFVYLLPGTYLENFVVDKPNVHLISMMGPEVTRVRGQIVIKPDMGRFVAKGINFDISLLPEPVTNIVEASSGLDSFHADNCWFYSENTEYGRATQIMNLGGTHRGQVHFNNCKFNGTIVNSLVPEDIEGFVDTRLRITNIVSDTDHLLTLVANNQSLNHISGADLIRQVVHNGGSVEIKNVAGMMGDWSDEIWNSIDPDNDDLESNGVPREGVISTAPYSANNRNYLVMTNVVLRYPSENRYQVPVRINKTGSCNYVFGNVDRLANIDTLSGNRELYAGSVGVDAVETVRTITATSNVSANFSTSRTWDVTLGANITFALTEDSYSINNPALFPNSYANSMTVLVRQGSGGSNTITFTAPQAIIWPDGAGQPATATGAGKISVYTFFRVGNTWLGSRSFNQV